MKNTVEATMIILLMFMVVEIVSDSSLACFLNGDESCSVHRLTCNGGKVIKILEAKYGYRRGCGPQKLPEPGQKNCSLSCCKYRKTDCSLSFSDVELQEIIFNCSRKENCKLRQFILHVVTNGEKCQDVNSFVNTYTVINFKCVNHKLSSTISRTIWPSIISTKLASTVQPLSRIQKSNTTSTVVVPSSSEPKNPTDEQSKGQPSDAIIGGIVAGIILLVILVVIGVYFIKRRKKNLKQVAKRHMPNKVTRKIRISAPIVFQNTTNSTLSDDQKNGEISNRKSEYENVDLETAIDSTPSVNHDYYQLETIRLSTSNFKTTAEPQSRGSDVYNHLGEDNSQQLNLDNSDYNHTSDFREDSDNYHHINADDFKIQDANDLDDDYSHIEDTSR